MTNIAGYLRKKGSPLTPYANDFVRYGRINRLDPRLLVAISGAESSFGRFMAGNNPFGWGPHIRFKSVPEAISTVASGLRRHYINEGLRSVAQIGSKWAPVGAGNDPTNLNSNWVRNVNKFLSEQQGGISLVGKANVPPTPNPQAIAGVQVPSTNALRSYSMQQLSNIASGHYDPIQGVADLTEALASSSGLPSMPAPGGRAASPSGGPPAGLPPVHGGQTFKTLLPLAKTFGLTVTSTTTGNHVPGSYHYQGRAVDFSGSPAHEAALARYALAHPHQFVEMFYTGPGNPGRFIKNGRIYSNSVLDRSVFDHHHDHVHLAR